MAKLPSRISTTVRNALPLLVLRARIPARERRRRPEPRSARAARVVLARRSSSRARVRCAPPTLARAGSRSRHRWSIPIDIYVWGDPATQPYVLFAHGWSSHGTRILPWVAPLRDAGYAVVAFDQAAHGRSGGTHTTLPDFTATLLAVGASISAPPRR